MINRRVVLLLAACAILSTSTAFAGGGGTKKDATISVRNDTAVTVAAFVNPNMALINALPPVPTEAQIIAAGGQLINPGATKSFKVVAGTYPLLASDGTTVANGSATVGKGQTKKFALTPAGVFVAFP